MDEKNTETTHSKHVPLNKTKDCLSSRFSLSSEPPPIMSSPLSTSFSQPKSRKLQSKPSTGFQFNPFTYLHRLSLSLSMNLQSTSSHSEMIQQQFNDLLNEPISEQHQRHFRKYFGTDLSTKTFTNQEFARLFQVKSMLSKRILIIFNFNEAYEKNSIAGETVIRIARLLWISPMSVKAFILFKLFDSNNDGKVSIEEIRSFYQQYLSEFKFLSDQNRFNEVIDIFLQGFFPTNENELQGQQELNFNQFYEILQRNPSVLKSLYLISIPDQDKEEDEKFTWIHRWWMYIKNNLNRLIFIVLYFLILISLIIYVIVYRGIVLKNYTVWQVIARIGGMSVNYNYVVAIILMLKQTMTIVRRIYFLRLLIPVDDHIDAHRFVGTMLCISASIHSFGHTIQFATHTEKHSWFASMFTTAAQLGWIRHSATITGSILFVLLIIMFICSLQCIRQRSGFYQLFRYTHCLFWPVFILLIVHARDFWKWAIGPMSLLFIEKIYLLKRHLPKYGRTRLMSVRIEDEHVLSLIIERPANFTFHIGEYINICLPNIVPNEWHPFTICSCPERKDILRLAITKKKNWTRKIYEHFTSQSKTSNDHNDLVEVVVDNSNSHSERNPKNVSLLPKQIELADHRKDAVACVEGPFSTCTSYIFDCEHVVLIGAGIGITPYISALESLIYRLRKQRCVCFHCGAVNYNQSRVTSRRLKKVDFIWINRDMKNFSWFLNILDEFEAEQESYLNATAVDSREQQLRYLDMHLYCTSIRSNDQAMLANLPYDLIANMYEVMQHQDMHTNLRTSTHVGRPPWKLLFAKFKAEQRSTNVFFTGNKVMGDQIKKHCDEHGFKFQHEPFF